MSLLLVLLCAAFSVLPPLVHNSNAWVDFRAVYAGTRCLLDHHNPYNVSELGREFRSEDGQFPPDNPLFYQAVTRYVNLPTTFILVAPLAMMHWAPALVLWMTLTVLAFTLALVLVWRLGATFSLEASTLLICIVAANCQALFTTGNTAGIVVGLCAIAVWCFLRNRFAAAGVLCLALSLAVKPHVSGLVWLYFLLAGGLHRRRALQSLALTAAIALAAVLWLSHAAPHWPQDWRANLAAIAAPGGIDDPGPHSILGQNASQVVDLQAAISVFRDDPFVYNLTSYLLCGLLFSVWMLRALRSKFSVDQALPALAVASAIALLAAYHRPWDAKLAMLAIPPCCMLWAEGNRLGKLAFLVTSLTIVTTGDLTLGVFTLLFRHLHPSLTTFPGMMLTVLLLRPASLALLGMGMFYLWIFWRSPALWERRELDEPQRSKSFLGPGVACRRESRIDEILREQDSLTG